MSIRSTSQNTNSWRRYIESNEQVSKDVERRDEVDHPELASLRFIAELEQISTTTLMVRMASAPQVLAQCDLFRWESVRGSQS